MFQQHKPVRSRVFTFMIKSIELFCGELVPQQPIEAEIPVDKKGTFQHYSSSFLDSDGNYKNLVEKAIVIIKHFTQGPKNSYESIYSSNFYKNQTIIPREYPSND